MSTDLQDYTSRLLLALRQRDVPGPRIAEALAEVENHVAESGEDPEDAFGSPRAYAEEVTAALRGEAAHSGERPALTWSRAALFALGGYAGAQLVFDGALGLAQGSRATLGLPAPLALLLGLVVLGGGLAWLLVPLRRRGDLVLDPRTGAAMTPPLPRWAWAALVAPVVLAVGLAVVLALAAR